MTESLDRLADETTLTHVIAAGRDWDPKEDKPEAGAGPKPPA